MKRNYADGEIKGRLWLKTARRIKGLSQREVAEAVGCTFVSYNRIEKGHNTPNVVLAIKIAECVGADVRNFLNEETISD